MRKTILMIAGCGLASGFAVAQEPTEGAYDPQQEMTQDQSDYGTERPTDPRDTTMGQDPMGTEHHAKDDLSTASASKLEGKTVRTATGEEIGEIDEVWTSSTDSSERIATVEVGGFLGIGERTIAIPLSDLQKSSTDEDSLQTSLTRSTIEAQPEFDETGYTRESDSALGEDRDY